MPEILRVITKSEKETQQLARTFAKEVLKLKSPQAVVVGLEGELGAGKTTFAKGFAGGLGIKETMKSPTFILMRVFKLRHKTFFHIDAYRVRKPKEFLALGFKNLLKDPSNILFVEWSDRITKILPKKYFRFSFKVLDKNLREITLWR